MRPSLGRSTRLIASDRRVRGEVAQWEMKCRGGSSAEMRVTL